MFHVVRTEYAPDGSQTSDNIVDIKIVCSTTSRADAEERTDLENMLDPRAYICFDIMGYSEVLEYLADVRK